MEGTPDYAAIEGTHIECGDDSLYDGVGPGVHEGEAGLAQEPRVRRGPGEHDERVARALHTPANSLLRKRKFKRKFHLPVSGDSHVVSN